MRVEVGGRDSRGDGRGESARNPGDTSRGGHVIPGTRDPRGQGSAIVISPGGHVIPGTRQDDRRPIAVVVNSREPPRQTVYVPPPYRPPVVYVDERRGARVYTRRQSCCSIILDILRAIFCCWR